MKHFIKYTRLAACLLCIIAVLESCALQGSGSSDRTIKIYDSWLYLKPATESGAKAEALLLQGKPSDGCERVNLPHFASPDTSRYSYYMRKFFVPSWMEGKRVSLHFGGASSKAAVWLNGEMAGEFDRPNRPFVIDIKPRIGENSLLLRLDNGGMLHSGAYILGADSLCFTFADEIIEGNSDISVSTFGIEGNLGSMSFCATVRNSYCESRKAMIEYRILDHDKKVLASGSVKGEAQAGKFIDLSDTVTLANITLWDIENPWIYTLELNLFSDGEPTDMRLVNFGFRNLEVSPGYVAINGRERRLMGVNASHLYPYVGPAISSQAHWRDAYRIKRGGFDFVNAAEIPHPDQFLCACDQYGIIVLDTSSDFRSRVRQNHPCILRLPDSRGVHVFGSLAVASRDDAEDIQVSQIRELISHRRQNANDSTFSDVLSNVFDPEPGPCNGVMTSTRLPKLSYYLFQSQRDIDETDLQAFAEPICKILSNWIPGQSKSVEVCTNCGSVELIVDGVSLGRKQVQYSGNMLHPSVRFDVSCAKPGTIKAISYIGSVPKAEDEVSTPGQPVRLKITIDERGTLISGNDVLLVHCYILDNAGNTVTQCSDAVQFAVTGTASLLSPPSVNAKSGVATCLVRTGNSANDFTISATCGLMYTVADK